MTQLPPALRVLVDGDRSQIACWHMRLGSTTTLQRHTPLSYWNSCSLAGLTSPVCRT